MQLLSIVQSKLKNKKSKTILGQSLIEFLLTVFAFMTVLFMIVQVSIGFAIANFIQYATYMAARALLSSKQTEQLQISAARSVLDKMLSTGDSGKNRFGGFVKGSGGGNPAGYKLIGRSQRVTLAARDSRNTAWEQGVVYQFNMKLYMLPIIPGSKKGKANGVDLESESWLGRDPSVDDCKKQLDSRLGTQNKWYIDNGC